jgi:asparagine synthase (glutamine-hydrolysing)
MCGISGLLCTERLSGEDQVLVERMNNVQSHRGPDDAGLWSDTRCILGHRRLSIIDLSQDGHQPFISNDGRYVLTYNGEIYNYIELREELQAKGWTFHTKTDTEVLLNAYLAWGKEALDRLNGMFAFALYDTKEQRLFLVRDRCGIKPLYYTRHMGRFIFASEIKALRILPALDTSLNEQALFDFLVFNRTDVYDETFLKSIHRVPKGHWMEVTARGETIQSWWRPQDYLAKEGERLENPHETVESLFLDSVKLRMRSDVSVGSCLSGGLDSSILVGTLYQQHLADEDFMTFTAAYPGSTVDECRYVDALNRAYPFLNFRTYPDAAGAHEHLQAFTRTNDEPTTTPAFYTQYEVMRLAKEHGVTVLLDGQGGDEVFAGYQYFHGFFLVSLLKEWQLGRLTIEIVQNILRRQDKSGLQTFIFQVLSSKQKSMSLARTLPHIDADFYHTYISQSRIFNEFFDAPNLNISLVRHFQYKLEHLLRMEDRNSMAFSLEARVPYLDHRLVEAGLAISANDKIRRGETKVLQKKALGQYTIPEILHRKDKIGFGTPQDDWFSEPVWQSLLQASCEYNTRIFSDIFTDNLYEKLPYKGSHRWKMIQLALWDQMDWSYVA